ncbi:hypothetical protein RFG22_06120, partial [Streptococcus ruminantium]
FFIIALFSYTTHYPDRIYYHVEKLYKGMKIRGFRMVMFASIVRVPESDPRSFFEDDSNSLPKVFV